MAWANMPATQTTDWSHVDFLNQFVYAFRERLQLVNNYGLDGFNYDSGFTFVDINLFSVGDDVLKASDEFPTSGCNIRTLQAAVEQIVVAFGKTSLFPTGIDRDLSVFSGTLYRDNFGPDYGTYDLATWRADAGLSASGFTRKYPREISSVGEGGALGQVARHAGSTRIYEHDGSGWVLAEDQGQAPDTLVAYGKMQAGDYLGPWIFNELKDGLSALDTVRFPTANEMVLAVSESGKEVNSSASTWHHYGADRTYASSYYTGSTAGQDAIDDAYTNISDPVEWTENEFAAPGPPAYATQGLSIELRVFRDAPADPDLSAYFTAGKADLIVSCYNIPKPAGFLRTLKKVYFRPGIQQIDTFNAFDTGVGYEWQELTGFDLELPVSDTHWETSAQWPWSSDDQTTIMDNPWGSLGLGDETMNEVEGFTYHRDPLRATIAFYIEYSGFTYP
jgi:hypothetical protein